MLDDRSRRTASWFLIKLAAFSLLALGVSGFVPPKDALAAGLHSLSLSCAMAATFSGAISLLRDERLPPWLDAGDEALAFFALSTLLRIAVRLA